MIRWPLLEITHLNGNLFGTDTVGEVVMANLNQPRLDTKGPN